MVSTLVDGSSCALAGSRVVLENSVGHAALRAGWSGASACLPGEFVQGAAVLYLAGQAIPVRQVRWQGAATEGVLEVVYQTIAQGFFMEQYVLLEGFPPAELAAFALRCAECMTRKIWVGEFAHYQRWLTERLGPLAGIPVSSPLRRLTEHLLCASSAAGPWRKSEFACSYVGSAIQPSFDLGKLGVQAVETLFAHTRGEHGVRNVEADKAWQGRDVDLLVSESGPSTNWLQVEVKNENKATGNLVLEQYSCFERKTPGWLTYSTAEVLVSCLWPTGDMFLMDFAKVREWVKTTPRKLRLVTGTVPQQNYHSLCYLAPISYLLDDLPEVVCLRIADWMPALYGDAFTRPSLIAPQHTARVVRPAKLH